MTAVSPGTAKVTVSARDGSGKKIVATVKVINPVTTMKITSKTGQYFLSRGKKLTLTAKVNDDASVKKVEWTSSNPKAATVKNGVVTAHHYKYGSDVVITAKATDGSGEYAEYAFRIHPKIKQFVLREKEINGGDNYAKTVSFTTTIEKTYNSQTARYETTPLFDGKIPMPYYYDEESTTYVLEKYSEVLTEIKVSNPNVLQFVRDEKNKRKIVPVNKGKCEIIYKAMDGSGATCKIKVTVK